MRYRNAASFGKRQEFVVVAELLRRGYDVYMTLVDDQQIDCILRLDENPPAYVDIQIKARSKEAKNPGTFAALEVRDPRSNFYFIFYLNKIILMKVIPNCFSNTVPDFNILLHIRFS